MNPRTAARTLLLTLAAGLSAPAGAGVYHDAANRPVHPDWGGYIGVATRVEVPLCGNLPQMDIPLRNVAAALNRLDPAPGNIDTTAADLPPVGTYDFESVALHELGHGSSLNHPDDGRGVVVAFPGPNNQPDEATPGPDGVFGTEDDGRGDDENRLFFPLTPNNSPFVVPAIADETTVTFDVGLRVRPGTWPWASTRSVATLLGVAPTVAMMAPFSSAVGQEAIRRPAPDDITTLRYANAGPDGLEGTLDDYRYFYYLVPYLTPAEERPANCITITMMPNTSGVQYLAATRYRGTLSATFPCYDNDRCFKRPYIEFDNSYNWHYSTIDTSNGEGDYVPLPGSDYTVDIIAPIQPSGQERIVVYPAIPVTVTVRVTNNTGQPLPAGSTLGITMRNGTATPAIAGLDIAGASPFETTVTVRADAVPSVDGMIASATIPGAGVIRNRVEVEDHTGGTVLTVFPTALQITVPPNQQPGSLSQTFPFEVRATLAGTETPVPNRWYLVACESQAPFYASLTNFKQVTTNTNGLAQGAITLSYGSTLPEHYTGALVCTLTPTPAEDGDVPAVLTFTATPPPPPVADLLLVSPTELRIERDEFLAAGGATLPVAVTALDEERRPVRGVEITVDCTIPADAGWTMPAVAPIVTDFSGRASTTLLPDINEAQPLNLQEGPYLCEATAGVKRVAFQIQFFDRVFLDSFEE